MALNSHAQKVVARKATERLTAYFEEHKGFLSKQEELEREHILKGMKDVLHTLALVCDYGGIDILKGLASGEIKQEGLFDEIDEIS